MLWDDCEYIYIHIHMYYTYIYPIYPYPYHALTYVIRLCAQYAPNELAKSVRAKNFDEKKY